MCALSEAMCHYATHNFCLKNDLIFKVLYGKVKNNKFVISFFFNFLLNRQRSSNLPDFSAYCVNGKLYNKIKFCLVISNKQ